MKKSFTAHVDINKNIIIPEDIDVFNFILGFFKDSEKITITIEPYIRKVEQSQMGLLHAYLKMIHEETGDDLKDLKTEMKERFGVRNDDGSLKSTANYTTTEMNKLIEGVVIFMTQFLNMHVPSTEEWKRKNIKT